MAHALIAFIALALLIIACGGPALLWRILCDRDTQPASKAFLGVLGGASVLSAWLVLISFAPALNAFFFA